MALFSGKNIKLFYYIESYWQLNLPIWWLQWRRKKLLAKAGSHPNYAGIMDRVNYYCKDMHATPQQKEEWNKAFIPLSQQGMTPTKVYYLDAYRYARWFPLNLKWKLLPGDINFTPDVPSLVKSRPIGADNQNGVLLKLNKIRHFLFVKDSIPWEKKASKVIFRGALGQKGNTKDFKQNRYDFLEKYFNHPMCDLGEISKRGNYANEAWKKPIISIQEHLKYKYVMALEGNDVASNLKWIMSSNSIAVMPKPKFETWFMEGRLIPNYHYIAIADDYSDLEERLTYYNNHPQEAQAIIGHAHEWVEQFKDKQQETLISLLVLEKYFGETAL